MMIASDSELMYPGYDQPGSSAYPRADSLIQWAHIAAMGEVGAANNLQFCNRLSTSWMATERLSTNQWSDIFHNLCSVKSVISGLTKSIKHTHNSFLNQNLISLRRIWHLAMKVYTQHRNLVTT